MVGLHLLFVLVVEAIAYAAIARHVQIAHGWSVGAAIALAIGIYVGVRVVLVGAEFIIGRIKGSPIPPELRVSAGTLFRMYVRELGGWLLMFACVMPYVLSRRSVTDGEPTNPSAHPPILLVHGLACNRGNWFWFKDQLRQRGFRVYTMDCTPPVARIATYGAQIHDAIEQVLATTGAERLTLIGHSQGGLAIRAYLDGFGDAKVGKIITMGSPHLGTFFARLALGHNAGDMRLGNAWLTGLSGRETVMPESAYRKFTCLFTYHDNLVAPQRNAVLPGSKAIPLSGIGHLSLVLSSKVVGIVVRELQS